MTGGICCDDAVRVAVQVLPLARGGVVQIQTGIGAHIQIDAHRAGEGFALVQLKLNALLALGQHEHGIQFTGGALDVAARDLHGVAVAHHAQGLAGGAQGVEDITGHSGNFGLRKDDLVVRAVLDRLHHGIDLNGSIVLRLCSAAVRRFLRGSGRTVDNDRDHSRSRAVGDRDGGCTGAHSCDHAAGADRGNVAVGGLKGELLRSRGRLDAGGQGAGGTGLEHNIGRIHRDDLTAVGRTGAGGAGSGSGSGSGSGVGNAHDRNIGGSSHRTAGSGDGGSTGGDTGNAAKIIHRGYFFVGRGQGDGGIIGGRGGPHLQLCRYRVADINGIGGQRKIHFGHDHGGIHGDHDGVSTDLIAGSSCDTSSTHTHGLYNTGVAHGQDGGIVRYIDHRIGRVAGTHHRGQLLRRTQQHIGGIAAGFNAFGRYILIPRHGNAAQGEAGDRACCGRRHSCAAGQQAKRCRTDGQFFCG